MRSRFYVQSAGPNYEMVRKRRRLFIDTGKTSRALELKLSQDQASEGFEPYFNGKQPWA